MPRSSQIEIYQPVLHQHRLHLQTPLEMAMMLLRAVQQSSELRAEILKMIGVGQEVRTIDVSSTEILPDSAAGVRRQNDSVHKAYITDLGGKIAPERLTCIAWTKKEAFLRLLALGLMLCIDEGHEPLRLVKCCRKQTIAP